jgi:ABC-2 type transport system ATP-binding protein
MLTVTGVTKSYGSRPALAGVSLDVAAGEILALLGPNGAGKTTLVSIVAGLRRPDSGRVRIDSVDVADDPHRAHRFVGLAPQETGVYLPLSVRDNLRYFAGLAGVRRAERDSRVDAVACALGLEALLEQRAADLSGGERRRLHTAMALVHEPALVLLDEPTTGADVRTRNQILNVVRDLADRGSAVVYSTHYLHEVENLGGTVAFIDRGRIVARGTTAELIARYGSSSLLLTFLERVPATVRVNGAVVDGTSVRIPVADPARAAAEVLPRLAADAAALQSIEIVRPSLESVYLAVTDRPRVAEEVA